MEGFASRRVEFGETQIFVVCAGTVPPLLLLHGFPQTHRMWRDVAPALARRSSVVCAALGGWGTPVNVFPSEVRSAYIDALRDARHVHAICEEYRAAAAIDRSHDEADRAAGKRIACPVCVLWSASGSLETWYADAGGPLALWHNWCSGGLEGQALDAGHFFPEERSQETAALLERFFLS